MSQIQYVLLAYAVGLGLLLGYAARLWLMSRRLRRAQTRDRSTGD